MGAFLFLKKYYKWYQIAQSVSFVFNENYRFELAVQIGDLKTAYEIAIEADVS